MSENIVVLRTTRKGRFLKGSVTTQLSQSAKVGSGVTGAVPEVDRMPLIGSWLRDRRYEIRGDGYALRLSPLRLLRKPVLYSDYGVVGSGRKLVR